MYYIKCMNELSIVKTVSEVDIHNHANNYLKHHETGLTKLPLRLVKRRGGSSLQPKKT